MISRELSEVKNVSSCRTIMPAKSNREIQGNPAWKHFLVEFHELNRWIYSPAKTRRKNLPQTSQVLIIFDCWYNFTNHFHGGNISETIRSTFGTSQSPLGRPVCW
jgi:hypothetical protein